ncbi:MAG: acyl-CoA dehydrogenase family protein, partial [Chloroflexi bacterium]|nr:acyl-CoA dehydrogenase family protein [Chloroflexota bacterium]
MDFVIPEELRLLQTTARRFVQEELYPLERRYLLADQIPPDVRHAVELRARSVGLWALGTPPELGGGGVPALGLCLVQEERYKALLGRSELDPFGGDPSPALLTCAVDAYQREHFLLPVIRGEKHECLCQTEPNAGSDPSSLETMAVREGDHYVLNGTKIFIGRYYSDIFLTLATVDRRHGRRGITAFLIERDTPGFNIVRLIPMMDGATPAHIVLDHCVVPASHRLGEEGGGFAAGQADLGRARIMWGPKCVGRSERCLEMGIRYAKQRVTFGRPIADRQAI